MVIVTYCAFGVLIGERRFVDGAVLAVVSDLEAQTVLPAGGTEPRLAQQAGEGRGLLKGVEDDETVVDGGRPNGDAAAAVGDAQPQDVARQG